MQEPPVLIVHFGELWLRGKNRGSYIAKLLGNISASLSGLRCRISRHYDRIIIKADEDTLKEVENRLAYIFGISNYELAYVSKPELSEIADTALEMLKGKRSVRINAHRSDKRLSFDSNDIIRKVSDKLQSSGITPLLRDFEAQLFINVTASSAYLYTEKHKGLGGLPVGSEGKCIALVSGGIDSPVAAWFAMKRGLEPVLLHLHAYHDNAEAMKGKIGEIAKQLSKYYPNLKVVFAPSYVFEAAAAAAHSDRLTLVLLKNFMLRLAQALAIREGANAIVTGESLGQVASQTAENLLAEGYGVGTLIIRPLIGFDKEDIIKIAKEIGTYSFSIAPYKDVCSISAKNPRTKARIEEIKELGKKAKLGIAVRKTLALASEVRP
ncbi:MAG: tRNA uracil 4-sulfurtransferase ThiI [Candidatus Micrarchaeia archaeon]